jgi:ligand-binding sensor domain-containing protein
MIAITPVRDPDVDDRPKVAGGPPRYFALAELPDGRVLAGTCGRGVARTDDGDVVGEWSVTAEGFAGSNVNQLLVDIEGGCVVAAAGEHGLLRSSDGGRTWEPIVDGASCGSSVFCTARAHHVVLTGTSNGVYSNGGDGAEWTSEITGPPSAVYRLVALRTGGVAAATESDGVWLRSVAGEWQALGAADFPVYSLIELDDGDLLAGTRGAGFRRWSTAQSSWRPTGQPVDPVVHTIVGAGDRLFAGTGQGVIVAGRDGERWTPVGPSLAHHRIFSLLPRADGTLIAGSYDGLWAMAPGEDEWTAIETGLEVGGVFAITSDADGVSLAGGRAGVFRSDDAGESWAQIRPDGVTGNAYCFCRTHDGTLYVGTDDGLWNAGRGEPGERWVRAGLDSRRVFTLVSPSPGELLAGLLGDGVWHRPAPDAEWRRSSDGLDHPLAFDLLVSPKTAQVLVATGVLDGGAKTGGIFRSSDRRRWRPAELEQTTVYDLCETSTGVIVAGAQRCRILRSTDAGRSFQTSRPQGRDESKMYCLAIDDDDRLYLGAGSELLRSDDAGDSWLVVGGGLDGVTVFGVACVQGDRLLAATSSGVYRSDDAGVNWTPSHWN